MKQLIIITILLSFIGCKPYREPSFLLSKDAYTLENAKKEAPYLHTNTNATKNSYFIYNVPESVRKNTKEWSIIKNKYKGTKLYYWVRKEDNNVYIYRHVYKILKEKLSDTMELSYFFDLLKKEEGVSKKDCEILINKVDEKSKSRYVLLLYNGVKYNFNLEKKSILVKSYLEPETKFWVGEGVFMMDTPWEIVEAWQKENKYK